jgi:hypothetical protein
VKWITPSTAPDQAYAINNHTLTCTVGSSALTIALKTKAGSDASASDKVSIAFRSATAATGTYTVVDVTGALSVVVSSGSTLGHLSGINQYIYVWAINNAGTVELAVSGSDIFDEGSRQSTTAEGGAGAADSGDVLYSTTARTNIGVRLLGRLQSNQVTAGTYAAVPTEVSLVAPPILSSWVDFTPAVISDGTDPTKATTKIRDRGKWRRVGNMMEFVYYYKHTNNSGAAAGTGNYGWKIPTGYTVDSNYVNEADGAGAMTHVGFGTNGDGSTTVANFAYITTQDGSLVIALKTAAGSVVGASGASPMNQATSEYSFHVWIPISGWDG